jgi:hypothetical protein
MTNEPLMIVGRLIAWRCRLTLHPRPQWSWSWSRRHVDTLLGVNSLQVSQRISNWPMTIEIVDIRDRGLEGLNFKVTDPEEGILSCLCAEIEVVPGP